MILANPSKDLIATEDALRTVIESLIDDQDGFRKIGEARHDQTLKRYFLDESLQRAEFRGELENVLHQEGVKDVHQTGTPEGAFLRLFTGLKAAFGAGPHALLKAAEEAERDALDTYESALEKSLPSPVRELLLRQVAHLRISHQRITAAREASE
jgi:uncharacterized protein (TIGR02284 family)